MTVETRRGALTVPAAVVETIRPDTVFIPYHWPEALAANQLTVRALDPTSKMPEFKVAACRVRAATADGRRRRASSSPSCSCRRPPTSGPRRDRAPTLGRP